jgi:hypothetical protein
MAGPDPDVALLGLAEADEGGVEEVGNRLGREDRRHKAGLPGKQDERVGEPAAVETPTQ